MLKKNIIRILKYFLLFQLVLVSNINGETVKIPGNATLLSRYISFYYNLPTKDFIYHLNDLLIFSEAPTKALIKNGIRKKILNIVLMEKKIDSLIKKRFLYDRNMFTINISNRKGLRNGGKLLNYLGLVMENTENGFKVESDNSSGIVDYYNFINLKTDSLEKQINKTNRIFYRHITSDIPFDVDFKFLSNATGISVNSDNFFKEMIQEKKFSIFLGIIFRLSDAEINYISGLKTKKTPNPWRSIYEDSKFLIGMFNLSTALRVRDNKLDLPGGEGMEVEKFWSVLADSNYSREPFKFLKSIVTSKNGKLNYLFSLSFFQPKEKIKPLFFNFDTNKMKKILDLIKLSKNEKLADNRFPRLRKQCYFNLIYALEEKNGEIFFPGDIKNWINIFAKKKLAKRIKNINDHGELFYLFVKSLLEDNSKNKNYTPVKKAIALYSKFFNRPELLDDNTLKLLYSEYNNYNILIDFIDKIDIKNQGTVINLFNWVKKLQNKSPSEKSYFSAVYQSYLEFFSFITKNHPNGYNFDHMINELIKIPLDKSTFIWNMFSWMNKELKIPLKESYINNKFSEFLLQGLQNRIINIENEEYEFRLNNITKEAIDKIIDSQEAIRLSTIFKFEKLFRKIISSKKSKMISIYSRIVKLFQSIPNPEISDEAPRFIKKRVMTYSGKELNRDLRKLRNIIKKDGNLKELTKLLDKFRRTYISPHLKNYLVTLAYAINAKSDRLRMFINPNLVKLHDFGVIDNNTPWNFSGRPESSLTVKTIPGFRLKGGLSRLNLLFATVWKDQMLAGNIIFDSNLIQSVIYDIFEFFPVAHIKYFPEYISLLIDYGLESLNLSKTDESINIILSRRIGKELSGYAYRKTSKFLKKRSGKSLLFYNQYYKIGKSLLDCNKCLENFSQKERLKKFMQFPLKAEIISEKNHFGNIYFNLTGSLRARWNDYFPTDEGMIFKSGYYSGETFNEFKMRLSYLATKKKYPPALYGHFLFNYLITAFPRFYQQNYDKDMFTTYFIFDIMNNSSFNKVIKKYKRKGYVRLK